MSASTTSRSPLLPLTAFLVLLTSYLVLPTSATANAQAQTPPTVTDLGVEASFPDRLTFRASAQGASNIEKMELRYEILPDGTRARADADIDPATSVTAEVSLQAADQPTLYLPPGTTIVYHWEATDAAGNTGESPEATFFYNDDRFNWTTAEQRGVTIYYYGGNDESAREMLDVSAQTIAEMSELLAASVDFPVKVWIYDNTTDMRPALPDRSETYEESVTTLGIRIASDTVLVLNQRDAYDTLRHELTHVITAAAGEGGLGSVPAWLDEGTAVYSQNEPGGFKDAVDAALNRGNVLSVRSITSAPGDPDKVGLFYGQSWSLVSYLNETYGPEKFAQLFAEIKTGKRIDSALEAVYGFDQDGLEDEWREANDLPPRETPEPDPEEGDPPSTDNDNPGDNNPGSTSEDSGGTSAGTVVGVLIATLALAGVIAFAGITLARRVK
jgi:hypothetical protein